MVKLQISNLLLRVRFSHPAPYKNILNGCHTARPTRSTFGAPGRVRKVSVPALANVLSVFLYGKLSPGTLVATFPSG